VDAAIAMDHMILAAGALGLGSFWIAAFDPEAGWEPLAFTPIGYPKESPAPRSRKALGKLIARA